MRLFENKLRKTKFLRKGLLDGVSNDSERFWKTTGNCQTCLKDNIPIEHCEYCGNMLCLKCSNFLYDNINYIIDPYDTFFGRFCDSCFNKIKDMKNENGDKLFEWTSRMI